MEKAVEETKQSISLFFPSSRADVARGRKSSPFGTPVSVLSTMVVLLAYVHIEFA